MEDPVAQVARAMAKALGDQMGQGVVMVGAMVVPVVLAAVRNNLPVDPHATYAARKDMTGRSVLHDSAVDAKGIMRSVNVH